jgi:hypothetical protein
LEIIELYDPRVDPDTITIMYLHDATWLFMPDDYLYKEVKNSHHSNHVKVHTNSSAGNVKIVLSIKYQWEV